jgi:hypothetical protein
MALFVAIFRMFCLMQIEMIRTRRKTPFFPICVAAGVCFSVYATIDSAASFDRAQLVADSEREIEIVLPTENLMVLVHILYGIVCAVWGFLAVRQSAGYCAQRLYVFLAFSAFELAATVFSQVVCVKNHLFSYTVLPGLIYSIVHMMMAAFALFLMHAARHQEYLPIKDTSAAGPSLSADEWIEEESGFEYDE